MDGELQSGPGLEKQMLRGRLREALFGEPAAPVRIGRFVVLRKLGAGGMGVVYSAYDEELDRKVAIKLLPPTAGAQGRQGQLRREAQAMARLSHPNVVPVFEVGAHERDLFVAMEFIDGPTLRTWVGKEPRTWSEILQGYVQAGRGLAAAHGAGIVHRDFKPDNVMVGDDGRARVLDFGLARTAGADTTVPGGSLSLERTETGTLAGTPAYMAPEQFLGKPVTEASDQFSFCVSLWESLFGCRPFASESYDDLKAAVCAGDVSPPPGPSAAPGWLRSALERGLAAAPGDRHPSMDALLDVLDRGDPRVRTRRIVVGTVGGALLVAAGVWLVRSQPEPCIDAQARIDEVWGAEARAAVRGAFPDSAEELEGTLDAYAERWSEIYRNACSSADADDLDERRLAQAKLRCLEWRIGEFDAFRSVISNESVSLEHALPGAENLYPVDKCDDTLRMRSLPPPPEDPEARQRVQALDVRLAEAMALEFVSDVDGARAIIEDVLAEAKELEYEPLVARALIALGGIDRNRSPRAAEPVFLEALYAAERGGADESFAMAAAHLGWVVGYLQGRNTEAQTYNALSRAALARIGGDENVEDLLLLTEAGVAEAEGRDRDNLDLSLRRLELHEDFDTLSNVCVAMATLGRFEQARSFALRALDERHDWIFASHCLLAVELGLGNHEAGRRIVRKAQEDARATHTEGTRVAVELEKMLRAIDRREGIIAFPPEELEEVRSLEVQGKDAFAAFTLQGRGEALLHAGEPEAALAAFRLALEHFDACCSGRRNRVWAATGLGRAQLRTGRIAEAVATLEASIRHVDADPRDPYRDNWTRLEYARALVASGASESLGRQQVETALESLEPYGAGLDHLRGELRAWLEAHPEDRFDVSSP